MFLTIKEYALHTRLSEKVIRKLVASGQIPSLLIGSRKRKINVTEADRALERVVMVRESKTNVSFEERCRKLKTWCA